MLEEIRKSGLKVSSFHYKQIITGLKASGKFEEALGYFEKFRTDWDAPPTKDELVPSLDCVVQAMNILNITQAHPQKAFSILSFYIQNYKLILCLTFTEYLEWAHEKRMVESPTLPYLALNCALTHIVRHQTRFDPSIPTLSLEAYQKLKANKILINAKFYYRLINILTRLGEVRKAETVFREMLQALNLKSEEKWSPAVLIYLFTGYSKSQPERIAPFFQLVLQKYNQLNMRIPVRILNTTLFRFFSHKNPMDFYELAEKSLDPKLFDPPNAETLSHFMQISEKASGYDLDKQKVESFFERAKAAAGPLEVAQLAAAKERLEYFSKDENAGANSQK